MFRLEPHQLLYVYASLGIGIVLLAGILHGIARMRRERAAFQDVMKCGMCGFQFRNANGLVHPRCPSCEALVERRPRSRL